MENATYNTLYAKSNVAPVIIQAEWMFTWDYSKKKIQTQGESRTLNFHGYQRNSL